MTQKSQGLTLLKMLGGLESRGALLLRELPLFLAVTAQPSESRYLEWDCELLKFSIWPIEGESIMSIGSPSIGLIGNNFWTSGTGPEMIFFEEEISGLCDYRAVRRCER